jgi:Fe2+ transport system protein FeoA
MSEDRLPLAVLQPGEAGTVVDVLGEGAFRRRLLDMGFVSGAPVRVIKTAPLMNPIEYCVGGTHVTLRRKEAMHILVEQRAACEYENGRVCGPRARRAGHGPGMRRGPRAGRGTRHRSRTDAGGRRKHRWWKRSSSE